jgi:hypothetical protein
MANKNKKAIEKEFGDLKEITVKVLRSNPLTLHIPYLYKNGKSLSREEVAHEIETGTVLGLEILADCIVLAGQMIQEKG